LIGYVNRNSQEVTLMPRLKEIAKKGSAPSKILHMALPDEETLAFWKMTAEDPAEFAARIAKFSRAVGGKPMRNAVQSSGRRWRDAATAARSLRPLGKVLVMPMHSDFCSRSSSR
jgi:hypothetical protein